MSVTLKNCIENVFAYECMASFTDGFMTPEVAQFNEAGERIEFEGEPVMAAKKMSCVEGFARRFTGALVYPMLIVASLVEAVVRLALSPLALLFALFYLPFDDGACFGDAKKTTLMRAVMRGIKEAVLTLGRAPVNGVSVFVQKAILDREINKFKYIVLLEPAKFEHLTLC